VSDGRSALDHDQPAYEDRGSRRTGAMWKLVAALSVVAAVMVGCGSGGGGNNAGTPDATAPAGTVRLLDPAEYRAAIAAQDAFVVNVHIPYEREIEGTDAFIPYDEVAKHADELPVDKSAPLYIYCRSGRMSALATPDLQRLGYTNIVDLRGGMQAWVDAGFALVDRRSD
jgi:phage shock protein E